MAAFGVMAGRPRIYESVEDLDEAIDSYKAYCIENEEKPTITGATLHLGFCDKTTLYDYRDREGFSHSIKHLLLFVENGYEKALHGNSVTGSIFALKNMGWRDKIETGFTNGEGEDISPVQIYIPDNGRTNHNKATDGLSGESSL